MLILFYMERVTLWGHSMLRSHDQQYYCAHFNSVTLLLLDTFAKEEITHSFSANEKY